MIFSFLIVIINIMCLFISINNTIIIFIFINTMMTMTIMVIHISKNPKPGLLLPDPPSGSKVHSSKSFLHFLPYLIYIAP